MKNVFPFVRLPNLISGNINYNHNARKKVSSLTFLLLVVGGLLSAHLLSYRSNMILEEGWPCNGPLLRLAVSAAERLLPGKIALVLRYGYICCHGICNPSIRNPSEAIDRSFIFFDFLISLKTLNNFSNLWKLAV